jgi:hypothetical protein
MNVGVMKDYKLRDLHASHSHKFAAAFFLFFSFFAAWFQKLDLVKEDARFQPDR